MTKDNEKAMKMIGEFIQDAYITDDEINELELIRNAVKAELAGDDINAKLMGKLVTTEVMLLIGKMKKRQREYYINKK